MSFRTVTRVSHLTWVAWRHCSPRLADPLGRWQATDMLVFNFFEPLHYFQHNEGFQTWELSPQFAIRSWAYVLLHWPLAGAIPRLLKMGKVSDHTSAHEAMSERLQNFAETTILRIAIVPRSHLDSMRGQGLPSCRRYCQ